MKLELYPMIPQNAVTFLQGKGCEIERCDFAVGVVDEDKLCGAIAMNADGQICSLVHLYTDGTALVGSILYGAAWRVCKALGYKQITI